MKYVLILVVLALIPSVAFAQATDAEEPALRITRVYTPPPPPPATSHEGTTFEANVGVGLVWAQSGEDMTTTESTQTVAMALGGWLNDSAVLAIRVAGARFRPTQGVEFTTGFLGPSLQLWTKNHVWFAGGAGLATVSAQIDGGGPQPMSNLGLGLDLRVGVTFNPTSKHTVNLSIEWAPGFFSVDNGSAGHADVHVHSLGLLLGYQYL